MSHCFQTVLSNSNAPLRQGVGAAREEYGGRAATERRRRLLTHNQDNALFDEQDYERYDQNSIVGVTSLHFDGNTTAVVTDSTYLSTLVGRCRLTPVETRVGSAWFHVLQLLI